MKAFRFHGERHLMEKMNINKLRLSLFGSRYYIWHSQLCRIFVSVWTRRDSWQTCIQWSHRKFILSNFFKKVKWGGEGCVSQNFYIFFNLDNYTIGSDFNPVYLQSFRVFLQNKYQAKYVKRDFPHRLSSLNIVRKVSFIEHRFPLCLNEDNC